MEVVFTRFSVGYACSELGWALRNSLPGITAVAQEFIARTDARRLVIVVCCPCCSSMGVSVRAGDVLASPLKGIDPAGYEIKRIGVYPPFRTPGENGETSSVEEFYVKWRQLIEKALE